MFLAPKYETAESIQCFTYKRILATCWRINVIRCYPSARLHIKQNESKRLTLWTYFEAIQPEEVKRRRSVQLIMSRGLDFHYELDKSRPNPSLYLRITSFYACDYRRQTNPAQCYLDILKEVAALDGILIPTHVCQTTTYELNPGLVNWEINQVLCRYCRTQSNRL